VGLRHAVAWVRDRPSAFPERPSASATEVMRGCR
jgi:hypothetical protein